MQEKPKRKINIGSLIGSLIFILAIAGGPILNLLRQLLGSSVSLPSNLLPILMIGLIAISILFSAIRALGSSARARTDNRLPTTISPQSMNVPMPPFNQARGQIDLPVQPAVSRPFVPPSSAAGVPSTPRFEPIINPLVLVLGIIGFLVLGFVGLIVLAPNLP